MLVVFRQENICLLIYLSYNKNGRLEMLIWVIKLVEIVDIKLDNFFFASKPVNFFVFHICISDIIFYRVEQSILGVVLEVGFLVLADKKFLLHI